jgi:hypothetical protein
VACLVKQHGWHWKEPRVLAGPWLGTKVHHFMNPEGELHP